MNWSFIVVHMRRKVKSEVIRQQRLAWAVAHQPSGLAIRRREKSNIARALPLDSRQSLCVRFAWLIDSASSAAGCPPGVVLKAGCRTAALQLPLRVSMCRSPHSWMFWAQGVRRNWELVDSPLPSSPSSSSSLHLPSSDKPHYEWEKARKYPLFPPAPAAQRLWWGWWWWWGGGVEKREREKKVRC